jgi:hypothetical protein
MSNLRNTLTTSDTHNPSSWLPLISLLPALHGCVTSQSLARSVESICRGILADRILRTDRDDDEGEEEWDYLRVGGCNDDSLVPLL